MATIFAEVSYDGTNYLGWQRQKISPTIQEVIENLLSNILNEKITIHAAGRTDAGVHAIGQTFHFSTSYKVKDIHKLQYALNRLLPRDIFIKTLKFVDDDFHARFNAKKKQYYYLISNEARDPLLANKIYYLHEKIDLSLLREGSKLFLGEHNFINFTTKKEDDWNFVRIIDNISIEISSNNVIKITLIGNGFMRYMVRMIVGTLIKFSLKKIDLEKINDLLNKEKVNGGTLKAPAYGLYLEKVIY